MLNGWERIVEMVQQRLPALIVVGLAETNGVIFQRSPPYQQYIPVWGFEASLEFVTEIAFHRSDNRLRLGKCRFELTFPAGDHIQDCYFQHAFTHRYTP